MLDLQRLQGFFFHNRPRRVRRRRCHADPLRGGVSQHVDGLFGVLLLPQHDWLRSCTSLCVLYLALSGLGSWEKHGGFALFGSSRKELFLER